MGLLTNRGAECVTFFRDYLSAERKALFIGTLGFNELCLHFPLALAGYASVDFLFLVESRPEVSDVLKATAERNRDLLLAAVTSSAARFETIEIVSQDDTANVAGRRAAKVCAASMAAGYADVFVDATSMSRGVCFPVVKQAYLASRRTGSLHAHVLVAGRSKGAIRALSTSSDAPQFVHGFQADMETDGVRGAIKLWIPQLSEGAATSLERIHRVLAPDEACPMLPFPSADPRRGDLLLREFQAPILGEWDVNLADVIYAHETDPIDVCETITRIDASRAQAFGNSTTRPARTILSPSGSRIGSVGMLLAALALDLPIMYEESIGYSTDMSSVPALSGEAPDHLWHIWLRP